MAFVNLKPLLPGHVLVSPRRVVPRLSDLSQDEISDLFLTVQRVGGMVERVFEASALNIALQDGIDAGQSVPHVHTHIIPRKNQDLESKGGNDAIYGMLEGEEGDVGKHLKERDGERPKFPKVDEASREPRTQEEMNAEADFFRKEMDSH
jgi:bis(5'-adenosyl)-triphosphatase